ncbi:hypothetical protein VTK73DRAFT_6208 [Phialemonium thermophilum]|uniref:Uncharacterized protein n=1 Tax=Phialemonium thermophilum TaxID=223376 RepID=A0ABR3XX08_9PEZI
MLSEFITEAFLAGMNERRRSDCSLCPSLNPPLAKLVMFKQAYSYTFHARRISNFNSVTHGRNPERSVNKFDPNPLVIGSKIGLLFSLGGCVSNPHNGCQAGLLSMSSTMLHRDSDIYASVPKLGTYEYITARHEEIVLPLTIYTHMSRG